MRELLRCMRERARRARDMAKGRTTAGRDTRDSDGYGWASAYIRRSCNSASEGGARPPSGSAAMDKWLPASSAV
ncbi:hypothetical protein GCM10019016_029960 [Streptomyces prasinosporus]|uniref:Uncharacterized protein n=1 Tax=Streptomyces prasinosporus TaxID=68256 RepID=A0ABP6TKY3_9ACTN